MNISVIKLFFLKASTLHLKFLIFAFIVLNTSQAFSYDPCKVKQTQNAYAESQCFDVEQSIDSPYNESKFILRTVLMTKSLAEKNTKDTVVFVPGGPGSDSQSIRMSFNQRGLLNAFWAHLNTNVVLFDPRSTGASKFLKDAEHYPQEVFTTTKQVSDLKKVIDVVSPQKPVYLLAHSAGGNTAARIASLYPDRVKGLILHSASVDNHQIGESNLRLFSKEFNYWKVNLPNIAKGKEFETLNNKRKKIEQFLMNIIKYTRTKKVNPVELRDTYLRVFREELIVAMENDMFKFSGRVDAVLVRWERKIDEIPDDLKSAINKKNNFKFDPKTHIPPILKRSNWIKTAAICSEGLTKSEINLPMWLDGLKLQDDICASVRAVYTDPPSRKWLNAITAPTLLISGLQDMRQIHSETLKNAQMISNSRLHIIEEAGHTAHISHSAEFYNLMEEFLGIN